MGEAHETQVIYYEPQAAAQADEGLTKRHRICAAAKSNLVKGLVQARRY